ncbi:MAG: B12-binding domain-containing radical SAM protein [Isosphaerales bacterium]
MRVAPRLDPGLRPEPVRPKYALLINPYYPKDPHASFGKHVLTPSLALTSIAGATPADWEVAYWDENLLQGAPPWEPFPQVVGITVHLTFAARAYELARWYRNRGARVVLGGLHVLSCPEEAAPHADALAIGEGVRLWPEILRDVEAGVLEPVYRGSYQRPYREEPTPGRDLLPRSSFLTTTSLIATRGCHNRCGFCYLATDGLAMPYQVRDVEQFDHDRADVFARTVAWIEENRLECATFHILTPYPGTPLFRQMEAENRLLHKDWSRYDTAHVVFQPKHMTADELAEGYAWSYRRLFSHRSIWRRRPHDRQAVVPYLAMSYLYKRSNFLWHLLIRHRLTARVWRPLVERTRRRHLRFRRRLEARVIPDGSSRAATVVPAGV